VAANNLFFSETLYTAGTVKTVGGDSDGVRKTAVEGYEAELNRSNIFSRRF
jgi:hypothetical protein